MKTERPQNPPLSELLRDSRNVEILRLVSDNPRIGVSELSRKIGMSAPAVRERLARLEEGEVIEAYRLAINPAALGYPISAYVRVRPAPGQLGKIADLARSLPQVIECHRVTGEDCFILKIFLPALADLDSVLDRFLAFGQTTTSLIQSSPVPLRGLPLPGDGEPIRPNETAPASRAGEPRRLAPTRPPR
ncbi:MAG TPA: Lrp/AsnC family transcriptional regulator [Roseiarcus sp.]|nr:Lrp/AsnC family transcriptional regulator [Roseiarcus sp.]